MSLVGWTDSSTGPALDSTIEFTGLNFAGSPNSAGELVEDTADYFEIRDFPFRAEGFPCHACQGRDLIVDVPNDVVVTFHAACNDGGDLSETPISRRTSGSIDLREFVRALGPDGCIGIKLHSAFPFGSVVTSYDVRFTYRTPSPACQLNPECRI